jgi:hypothetical protein
VVGGLVPTVLTRGATPPAPPHLGTTDVDTHLSVHFATSGHAYTAIEEALKGIGFKPDPKADGWRWFATIDGYRVNIEFLCDVEALRPNTTVRAEGASLGAANLRGTRYVEEDWVLEDVEAKLVTRDETVKVQVRFAGLEGYLLAKAHAIQNRGQQKDYYDFAYVLIHNRVGGPAEAGKTLRIGKFAKDVPNLERLWREIAARYERPTDIGSTSFAVQAMQAEPENDEARLRQDAVAAVREFTMALR